MAHLLLLAAVFLAAEVLCEDYRLPHTVTPLYYTIKLVPYFEERNFTFDGEVQILVNATTTTDNITLHYDKLEILETPGVTSLDGLQELEVLDTSYDNETNLYTLQLSEVLRIGQEYLIQIKYQGDLKNEMTGFYRCSYNTSNNETRWLAVTQFEPTDARRAFPCFDEPALKARFQVNIARTADYHSVSNMPLENSSMPDSSIGGRIWDAFKETPPMSTYLVAFVVSDLKNLTSADGKYSVWLREKIVSQGKYALSIAQPIIKAMESYTEIQYELPKLDQVAIPDHFFWAMENWGLVTIMEAEIATRKGVSEEERKQDTLLIVAHEFAHLWFGDLVSPKWWDSLWLNEGFATFYEYKISSQMEPDWQLDEVFVVEMLQSALTEDSLNSTHPVVHSVSSPKEINALFDVISYDKAGAIIRSMESFLTEETMRKGLSKYLKAHSHSVAESDDLFHFLNEQQKKDRILPEDMDVKTIMESWTLQPGYPVLHVTRVNGGIQVTQERFLLKGKNDSSAEESMWWVPISYTTQSESDFSDTRPRDWLRAEPERIILNVLDDSEWIILNLQATGFYRVNYDPLTWSLITKHLMSDEMADIHVLNRAQLLDDAFSLARAGLLNYTSAFDLSTYLAAETHSIPWESFDNKMSYVSQQLYGSSAYTHFKKYILSLLGNLYDLVGFSVKSDLRHHMKTIQPNILSWACSMDHKDCVTKSIELFADWMAKPNHTEIIPDNLKSVVYCTAVRNNKKMWEFLMKRYQVQSDNDDSERRQEYQALGCTEDQGLLKRYLNISMSEEMKEEELEAAVYYVIHGSSVGVVAALDFLSDNLADVLSKTEDNDTIGYTVRMIANHITTREQANKLKGLLEENGLDLEAEEHKWIPETMDEDILWTEKHYEEISAWLVNYLTARAS